MRESHFGKRLALVLASALVVCPAYAQTPPRPTPQVTLPSPQVVRPMPPVTQPAPQVGAPIRPRTAQPGVVTQRDADGDGHEALSFGGDDCDDANANRFPGNPEVANTQDEDCNASTYGGHGGDADNDGFISDRFSNPNDRGGINAGDDCDDSEPSINPRAQELPNRLDDDCDFVVDNLLGRWWTPPTQ